jgi:hypothetical protein
MILLEGLIVIVAAAAAWFLPAYGASLPVTIPMTVGEAHLMAVYLVVIGGLFIAVRPRHKGQPAIEPPAEESAPPPAKPDPPSDGRPPND